MICIFCGKPDVPEVEYWNRTDGERRPHQVEVRNHPICGDCMVAIQERMNQNEAMRRAEK
ncbi:MAG: hypothetical protein PHF12_08385 [Candidatus Omnitrophica bacterium]|nr:hypothetical protein [Candidatus Omnitrophota bacterium]